MPTSQTSSPLARISLVVEAAISPADFVLPVRREAAPGGSAPNRRVDAASRKCVAADPCLDTPVTGNAGAGGHTSRRSVLGRVYP
jgi:hypothetical protein